MNLRSPAKSKKFKRPERPSPQTEENRDVQLKLVKREFSRAKDYSSEYDQGDAPIAHFFNLRLKRVSEMLGEFNRGRVLDVGCGPARIANWFRGRPIEYHGVDISEEMIKECTNAFGDDAQFRFSLGKMEELPFPDSHFDVVLCLGVFEYVLDSRVAISEISRVLKPGGTAIITMLNGKSPYRAWQGYAYWKYRNGINRIARFFKGTGSTRLSMTKSGLEGKRPEIKLYGETAFRNLIMSGGLEIDDVVYYDFNLFLSPLDTRFPRASVLVSRKLEFLCRSWMKFLGTGFILKCRKA